MGKNIFLVSILFLMFTVQYDIDAAPKNSIETKLIAEPTCSGDGGQTYKQPNGPFALLIHCEDALGKYISVIYWSKMGAPSSGAWSLGDRVWSSREWRSGIVNFFWIGKNTLVLATENITGENAGIFRIDLLSRIWERIYSPAKGFEGLVTITDYQSGEVLFTEKNGEVEKKNRIKLRIR